MRTLNPIKDHQTVVNQQPDLATNVTKASDICLITGDDEIIQHIIPLNKSGPQEIVTLWVKEDDFRHAHKKSCVIYSSQEAF